ncbi:MAG: hypothetical protein EA357_05270, partial [Micavibrio sp.]
MSDYLIERSGWFYYFRRVPKHISAYDTRKHIKISLKTKDKTTARRRAMIQNDTIEKFWRDLMAAGGGRKDDLYHKAVQAARTNGFIYRDISELSENAGLEELVERLLALKSAEQRLPEQKEVLQAALIGTAGQPQVKLSDMWDIYRPKCADRLLGKTEHQIRKWENPRKLAIENLIKVIGDKHILDVTRKDILAFRDWWLERVTEEGKKPASANKNFINLKDTFDKVFIALDIDPPIDAETLFAKIKLKVVDDSRRSYEADYIQRVFLNSDALSALNDEARALFFMMADTGARVAEITGLLAEDIRLDTDIPYIHIRSNELGGLKTPHSDRQIPLVGAA